MLLPLIAIGLGALILHLAGILAMNAALFIVVGAVVLALVAKLF